MQYLEKQKKVLELSEKFIKEGFKDLKQENPEYFEQIKSIMDNRFCPPFLCKYLRRKKERIEINNYMEEAIRKTKLTRGQINYLINKKGYTISEILKMK